MGRRDLGQGTRAGKGEREMKLEIALQESYCFEATYCNYRYLDMMQTVSPLLVKAFAQTSRSSECFYKPSSTFYTGYHIIEAKSLN